MGHVGSDGRVDQIACLANLGFDAGLERRAHDEDGIDSLDWTTQGRRLLQVGSDDVSACLAQPLGGRAVGTAGEGPNVVAAVEQRFCDCSALVAGRSGYKNCL